MEILCREVIPFPPLTMCEIKFWLRIMREHALFIKLGLPCDQTELQQEAQCFITVFGDLEKQACRVECEQAFVDFVNQTAIVVKNIFAFKRHVLHLLIECKIRGGANYPLLIDHVSREALYFLKLLDKIRDGEMKYPVDAIVSENVFWLKIMADHLKFIRGLLDPSENELFEKTQALNCKFDSLFMHAYNLESMLWHFKPNNDLARFECTVVGATQELRDFKATAEKLIAQCAALSLIPPLLADHVRREAEHFLEILDLIQAELTADEPQHFVHCGYAGRQP